MTANTEKLVGLREFLITAGFLCSLVAGWLLWDRNSIAHEDVTPAENAEVLMVWPDGAKDKQLEVAKEYDTTSVTSDLVAGKRVQRITNVGKAELHFWPAKTELNTGTSVVICPGGGFHILAWDLEGTEIASWLNSIGVNAFILKYRVPTAKLASPSLAPMHDLHRSIALVRSNAAKWSLDPDRIGALGFSAGGCVVAAASFSKSSYEAIDDVDSIDRRPNFIIPVYGARMVNRDGKGMLPGMELTKDAPPAFLVHAYDDFVPIHNTLELARLYKKAGVKVECHVFDTGGHGFGARYLEDSPITHWPKLCESWMKKNGWLDVPKSE
ncbi:MAG: alpha/beta hydrolase [Planctomycetota bacterium]